MPANTMISSTPISSAPRAGLSDLELAQGVAAGDGQSFEVLMRRHNRILYRVARSILKNDADAEDALQLAYLHAYQGIAGFRGQSKLSTWLTRIVLNEALMRVRQQGRDATVIALEGTIEEDFESAPARIQAESADERPDALAMRAQTRALIESRIDALPEAFRTVFILRALEELSVEETASSLGIPEATVRTRFFRARSLLRESLAREMDTATSEAFSFDGDRCNRVVRGVLDRIRPPNTT